MFSVANLKKLQDQLKKDGLKAYIVLSGDPHNSEYAAPYFMAERLFFCPFSGDAGTLLVTPEAAYLFTDGRFFIQAEAELKNTGITLMRMGNKDVPSLEEMIAEQNLYPLGVNKEMLTETDYLNLIRRGREIRDVDYSCLIIDRPVLSSAPLVQPDADLFDKTAEEKINDIKEEMKKKGAEANLITTLDDIAWILNLRGQDIPCNPVFYSYLYISLTEGTHLFIDGKKVGFPIKGVQVHPYETIVPFVKQRAGIPTLVNPNRVNARLFNLLRLPVSDVNPSGLMKAIKGSKEIANTKRIQIIDGLALVKFMLFLKKNISKGLTEYDYSVQLEKYRKENKDCFDLSFETIAAVGPNAAMMHYGPTEKVHSDVTSDQIELLVDSGGQYWGGTTDTTRTFLIGKPTSEYVHDYTLTLKSVIALTRAVFLDGTSGIALDVLARQVMWNEGLDYKCGTGHGVGYMLNVHEGPNGFRYRIIPHRDEGAKMVPGMITTIEPGVYKQGKYGIRIENNVVCVPAYETEMGVFYKFETITMVPIETSCLDLSLMTKEEIEWLNDYHRQVFNNLAPLISDSELLSFLKEQTKKIGL